MSDIALKSLGLACAAGSVWFAVHMFTHQEGGPRIYAMQDFAIFAQPNRVRAVEAAVRAASRADELRKSGRAIAIDMTPVGAVPPRAAPAQPGRDRPAPRIADIGDDSALLETERGFRRVRVGEDSAEVGRILSIRKLADYWIVVGAERSIAQRAPVAGASLGQD
jgi:hypothetical protein